MKNILRTTAFTASLLFIFCAHTSAQKTASQNSTNETVVGMLKAGLSPEVVIAKIKNSPCSFDTSAEALSALKKDSVPETVILAVVEAKCGGVQSGMAVTRPDDPMVTIYVYRRKEFQTRNLQPTVSLDKGEVARMDDGKFFVLRLEPGSHVLSVNKDYSGADINMKAGEEYFFRVSMKPGFLKTRGEIEYVPREQGMFELKKMNPLESKWIKDSSKVTTEIPK